MSVSTIYYVTQEKESFPAKEDFIESLIAPDEGQLCDFFENEVPFFVEGLMLSIGILILSFLKTTNTSKSKKLMESLKWNLKKMQSKELMSFM